MYITYTYCIIIVILSDLCLFFKVFCSTVTYNEMLNYLQFFIVYGNS